MGEEWMTEGRDEQQGISATVIREMFRGLRSRE
jgi:hypothetical protein